MTRRKLTSAKTATRITAVLFGLILGGCASVSVPVGDRVEQLQLQRFDAAYNPCAGASQARGEANEMHGQCFV